MTESHVISALKEKRAQVSGIVRELRKRVEKHKAELAHIDATIKLFAPGALPESIPPKRPYQYRTPNFRHGEISKRCLDVLRRASGASISPTDIAATMIQDKGLDAADEQLRNTVAEKVSEALKAMRKRGIVAKQEERGDNRWQIA